MQIRKTYTEVNPELLHAEIKDFALKQKLSLSENKMETYTLPDQSASFISRSTMTFKVKDKEEKESLRVHIVGSVRAETKLMIDVDEALFPQEKLSALQEDIDFIFGSHEMKNKSLKPRGRRVGIDNNRRFSCYLTPLVPLSKLKIILTA